MHAGASSPSASFSAGGRRRGQVRCMPAGDNDPRHDDLLPCLLLHLHRRDDDDLSNPIVPVNIYNLIYLGVLALVIRLWSARSVKLN